VAAATAVAGSYEIIFVNDGSPDDSLEVAVSIFEQDEKVRILDLSRNFGHHKAIMTGLAHSRGRQVFLIDCDLEEPPEVLAEFTSVMRSSRADVVYGVQKSRKGGFFERVTGSLFYSLLDILSNVHVPRNVVTARLMSRRYVESLIKHRDREVFLLGLWTITGYKQVPCAIQKGCRHSSTYSFRHKIAVLVNCITSFSNKPLIYIFYLGSLISIVSLLSASYLIVRRLFFGVMLAGWPSLIISLWLLGGIMIFSIGIIGIYLSKIFSETKRRPYTIIRQCYEHERIVPK
jgi:putative glycosyltransferase